MARDQRKKERDLPVNSTHPDLASQAHHELVAPEGMFASRNVVDAQAYAC
jgi:hypothetical protein